MRTEFVSRIIGNKILMIISVIIILAFISTGIYAQSNNPKKTEVSPPPPPPPAPDKTGNRNQEGAFQMVDVMPSFPGGDDALMKHIADSIRYPKDAKDKGITGKVIVRFMVKYDGSVSDVSVLKGVSTSLDNEAIRVIKTLPNFTAGKLNGEYVSVWYMLPVNYAME